MDYPIPSTITLRTGETFPTDVIQIGELIPHSDTRCDEKVGGELLPGLSIGHPQITAGTLGCIVRRRDAPGRYFILSNFHVLGNDGAADLGSPIIQPATADGGSSPLDNVATLAYIVPFHFDGSPCRVDAALGLISEGRTWKNDWRQRGNIVNVRKSGRAPVKSERVHKIGRTSGYTTGVVIDPDVEALKIRHKEPGGLERKPVIFADQVLCTKYADGGDSGSIVFGDDGLVLGLHMSGNDEVSVFNKIENIINALDIVLME